MGLVYDYTLEAADGNSLTLSLHALPPSSEPGLDSCLHVDGKASVKLFKGTFTGCVCIDKLSTFVQELDAMLKNHQGTVVFSVFQDVDRGFCLPVVEQSLDISFVTLDPFTIRISSEFVEWQDLGLEDDNIQARLSFAFVVNAEAISDSMWDLKAIYQNLLGESQAVPS